MMRSSGGNIVLQLTTHSVSVTENDLPITVAADYYPLALPQGVSATPATFVFDKLGRTTADTITLTGSGNTAGTSAVIQVEASGYAYAN